MAKRYELKKSSDGQFFFTLHADNNEKILTSEMYKAKPGALNGIASVKTNSPNDARYERKTSKAGRPYFVLKAANAEVIGTSEEYSSAEAMENGIAAVKNVGPAAPTEDKA
jgi:uncharacterized protein YegP (UPF0339 family)